MLNDLIGRVEQTQLTEKDPEAEQLLNQRLGRNPNALYILAQTVLVQKYALEQAQAQLAQLRHSKPSQRSSLLAPPAFWATCWATVIRRLPRRLPHLQPGYGARPMPSLGTRLPRTVLRLQPPGWWLKLSPHRRDHGSGSRCRGAGLSGGRIVDARLRWQPGRSGRRRIFGGGAAGGDRHQQLL